uniref:Ig-like domain-containing protein n=1 Tax=Eptatretus burgeri TaxID=7764 RepID=A0A8C4R7T8_EPTBU
MLGVPRFRSLAHSPKKIIPPLQWWEAHMISICMAGPIHTKLCICALGTHGQVMGITSTLPFRRDTISDLHLLLFEIKSSYENLVYNSASNYTSDDFKGRIEPVGNPSEADGLLRIRNLTMEDRGTFRCRFEWRKSNGDKDGFSVREGKYAKLQVDVAPKILRIWKEFVNSSNSWRLFCETKAKPAPNITLWNPKGDFMVEVSVDQNYPNKLQQIIGDYNITEEDPPGNYSCLVMNIHGTAREYILYEGAGRKISITTVVAWSTSLCLVLLFIIGIYIYRKKWKPQEGEVFELTATPPHLHPLRPRLFSCHEQTLMHHGEEGGSQVSLETCVVSEKKANTLKAGNLHRPPSGLFFF